MIVPFPFEFLANRYTWPWVTHITCCKVPDPFCHQSGTSTPHPDLSKWTLQSAESAFHGGRWSFHLKCGPFRKKSHVVESCWGWCPVSQGPFSCVNGSGQVRCPLSASSTRVGTTSLNPTFGDTDTGLTETRDFSVYFCFSFLPLSFPGLLLSCCLSSFLPHHNGPNNFQTILIPMLHIRLVYY